MYVCMYVCIKSTFSDSIGRLSFVVPVVPLIIFIVYRILVVTGWVHLPSFSALVRMSEPAVFLNIIIDGWPVLSLSGFLWVRFASSALRGHVFFQLAPLLVVLELLFFLLLASFLFDLLSQLRLVLHFLPVVIMAMASNGKWERILGTTQH